MIRSWRKKITPINRIPPEILALIPDFWDTLSRGRNIIALTHVCRAWREVFTSRSALWTDLDCIDLDKTEVYLERSKSSPINLSLHRYSRLSPWDPFVLIIPRIIGRLKSLSVWGTPGGLRGIVAFLSRPAPFLEDVSIYGDPGDRALPRLPILTSALFNGDLSSLRSMWLQDVHTELPWRNMANLTSFTLAHTQTVSTNHLLDFFEGAPRLREVELRSVNPTPGGENGRLVSLACLKRMDVTGGGPPSVLLGHLLIPAGARLMIQRDLGSSLVRDYLPRSLDNLRNFSDFTTIRLYINVSYPRIVFSGPNGRVNINPTAS